MTRMYNPPHPGEVLREYLGDVSVTEAAMKLGVNRVTLSRVVTVDRQMPGRKPSHQFGFSFLQKANGQTQVGQRQELAAPWVAAASAG